MDWWQAALSGAFTGAAIELAHWYWNRRRR